MPEIKLIKNVVSGGKILLEGESITVADSVDYSFFGELIKSPKKPKSKPEESVPLPEQSVPATEQTKRSRPKSESKSEKGVEDGTGDNS